MDHYCSDCGKVGCTDCEFKALKELWEIDSRVGLIEFRNYRRVEEALMSADWKERKFSALELMNYRWIHALKLKQYTQKVLAEGSRHREIHNEHSC